MRQIVRRPRPNRSPPGSPPVPNRPTRYQAGLRQPPRPPRTTPSLTRDPRNRPCRSRRPQPRKRLRKRPPRALVPHRGCVRGPPTPPRNRHLPRLQSGPRPLRHSAARHPHDHTLQPIFSRPRCSVRWTPSRRGRQPWADTLLLTGFQARSATANGSVTGGQPAASTGCHANCAAVRGQRHRDPQHQGRPNGVPSAAPRRVAGLQRPDPLCGRLADPPERPSGIASRRRTTPTRDLDRGRQTLPPASARKATKNVCI